MIDIVEKKQVDSIAVQCAPQDLENISGKRNVDSGLTVGRIRR